ncbi:MAG: MYXO-CTERM sorting domain-containing protein, partial [Polyangiales bacterium]
IGGQVAVMIKADRVFAASSQVLPNVAIALPTRTGAVTTRRALDWIGGRAVTRAIGPRVVLPISTAAGLEYRAADQLDIETTERAGRWDVFVGLDGAPLLRRSRLYFATSTLQYDVGVRYPIGTRHAAPAPLVSITAAGTPTTTAADGAFAWTGSASTTVVPGLVGPEIDITNFGSTLATASLTAQPGVPVVWSMASDEYADAQLTSFISVGMSKARARVLMPSIASWLDQPISVTVNEDDTCNAYSTGDDIHFFRKSTMCENTGRLADVIDHEFGHSVHFHANQAGNFSSSLAEGVADFFASTIVDDHGLGRGFAFTDAAVRDIDPTTGEAIWPRDRVSDPHITGLIIAGALWDLRTSLFAQLGPTTGTAVLDPLFAGVLQNAPDILGSYLAARTADDDDGNLGNGTPHGCTLEAAFGRHGLAGATFASTEVGTPVVTGTSFSVPVTIPTGNLCPPPLVTSVELRWHVGTGAPSTVAFMQSGTSWVGALPTQPDNTVVAYSITARLDDGSVVAYPQNAAAPEYTLFVGTPTEIWCEHFDVDPMWTNGTNSDWQWGIPKVNASGDPSTAYAGGAVLGTDVWLDGRYTGNVISTITAPMIDVPDFDQVHLQLRRWLTVEDATYDQATIAVNGTTVWTNAMSVNGDLDHIDREWRFQDVDLTSYAGGPVQLSFTLASDMARELGGWTLDEVCLVGVNKHAACGDSAVDDGEQCDDGNTTAGDGCSTTCTDESDGGCCSAGTDPSGPLLLGLGIVVVIARRRRR